MQIGVYSKIMSSAYDSLFILTSSAFLSSTYENIAIFYDISYFLKRKWDAHKEPIPQIKKLHVLQI